jgi:hypothetical protein
MIRTSRFSYLHSWQKLLPQTEAFHITGRTVAFAAINGIYTVNTPTYLSLHKAAHLVSDHTAALKISYLLFSDM